MSKKDPDSFAAFNSIAAFNGVLVVNKPVGPTSHDVVATARRALRVRRVGHTGTLDPQASGVLPLVIGNATRLAQYLTAAAKEYEATIRFGVETDTYDGTGRVERQSGLCPTADALAAALDRFRGAFEQVPPPYSAKKIGGERAYDLARRATPIALAPVPVVVSALDLLNVEGSLARIRIVCSAGFSVRSLAHDVGRAVGTGAVLEHLVRTRAGAFTAANAVTFADLAAPGDQRAALGTRIIPPERLLEDVPAVGLTEEGARRVRHGMDVGPAEMSTAPPQPPPALVRLLSPEGRLIGLAEPAGTAGFWHPAVVLASNAVK